MSTMHKARKWQGPAILSFGFRPFFLAAAIYALIMLMLWVGWLAHGIALPSALPPVAWHQHELVFGYVMAVIAGFMLTAVPNWTGRLPVVGWPLAGLITLWLAGRLAINLSAFTGFAVAGLIALLFPVCLTAVAAREVVGGNNRRNLVVIAILAMMTVAQAVFLAEILWTGDVDHGGRLAIGTAVMLVALIGGRIVPSFTTNWLRGHGGGVATAFGRLDAGVLLATAPVLLLWVATPDLPGAIHPLAAGVFFAACGLHLARQWRWQPARTLREPLVAILHTGYAFIPVGFALAGLEIVFPELFAGPASVHAFGIGTIGTMTLAVMTRATRGHTGRDLTAPGSTVLIYAAIIIAALSRMVATAMPDYDATLLTVSASAWIIAFGAFCAVYGPMLLTRRIPQAS